MTVDTVTYVGHATVEIELDGVRLLTDPVLRRRVAHLRRQVPLMPSREMPDAILISHLHFDHLDLPSLRSFGTAVRLITGPGAGALLRRRGFERVEELAVGESAMIGPVDVTAVPALHDGRRSPMSRAGDAIGFLIRGSRQIYFAGDTDLYPEMEVISANLDLALLPVWGWGHTLGEGHMDPRRAARAVELVRPRLAIPIHWGTLFPIAAGRWGRHHLSRPPQAFADQVAETSPEVEVRLLDPGGSTSLG